jgi:hypothetical protein
VFLCPYIHIAIAIATATDYVLLSCVCVCRLSVGNQYNDGLGAMVSWHWFPMGAPDGVRAELTHFSQPTKVNENHNNETNLFSMGTFHRPQSKRVDERVGDALYSVRMDDDENILPLALDRSPIVTVILIKLKVNWCWACIQCRSNRHRGTGTHGSTRRDGTDFFRFVATLPRLPAVSGSLNEKFCVQFSFNVGGKRSTEQTTHRRCPAPCMPLSYCYPTVNQRLIGQIWIK